MKKRKLFLFAPWFMGVLFIVFAISMAFATFIENDFGAKTSRAIIYEAKWFELILILLVVNLTGQIFNFKLYKRNKLSILLFHLAFVLIIIGAAITRYFGFEGTMHIREGDTQNICTSTDKYINFDIKDNEGETLYSDSKKVLLALTKKIRYNKTTTINNTDYTLRFNKLIPNAIPSIIDDANGKPMISLIISNQMMSRQSLLLEEGNVKNFGGMLIGFNSNREVDIKITYVDEEFYVQSPYVVASMSMAAQESTVYDPESSIPFEEMNIYKIKGLSIVPEKLSVSAKIRPVRAKSSMQSVNKSAMIFDLDYANKSTRMYLWIGQNIENTTSLIHNNHIVEVSYKSLEVKLPFSIKLNDFILDRYPGSSSPSSYKSNVTLIDHENNVTRPYSIYMNHILKYKGWRFYQSWYDRDEQGTVLSVNKDYAGMVVTYIGYFTLFLFIILSLLNKKSLFRTVTPSFFRSTSGKVTALVLLLTLAATGNANAQNFVVNEKQADQFGKILVQDQRGRTEPLYTLSNDILRKVSRKTEIEGYTSMQVFLGFYFDFQNWQNVPLIKISNNDIKKMIGTRGDYAAFSDLVDLRTNVYKLRQRVKAAYNKPAGARDKFDKEIIKVDERVNVCYMIFSGEFFKIFPVNDKSQKWYAPKDAYKFVENSDDSLYVRNIVNLYADAVQKGSMNGNFDRAEEILQSIINYQRTRAQYELPAKRKVNAEIFYYKSKIYDKLFPFYATVGIVLLIILIYGIIAQKKDLRTVIRIFTGFLIVGFGFHTLGLVIRWYISGHAPMSNGYESMIFISWVTLLAGFIFKKRSAFVLAATSVLGGFTLMVAHLSFMDPEITNLVPVLQSYWLTLHVSVITGSYGFLGLGAIIGIIVLVLYALLSDKNKLNITSTIEELTVINYKSLTIGLYLLTIGTFLGAVWANESWGRYWGWDPKETWSLITIIVYSFIIHSRLIPGLKGFYSFNLQALVGFASVLMTYFGVNYYLTGLHSYAGGDKVTVPNFVYVSVVILVTLSLVAYWKKKSIIKEH